MSSHTPLSVHSPVLTTCHVCCAVWCALCACQVLAFLRVFVQQSLAAFRSHSASSIAGLPESEQQVYVIKFLREYLSQAWFDKLASSYNLSHHNLSEFTFVQ